MKRSVVVAAVFISMMTVFYWHSNPYSNPYSNRCSNPHNNPHRNLRATLRYVSAYLAVLQRCQVGLVPGEEEGVKGQPQAAAAESQGAAEGRTLVWGFRIRLGHWARRGRRHTGV